MKKRSTVVLFGCVLLAGSALASRGESGAQTAPAATRPVAVSPQPELPTARDLELRAQAQKLPTGVLRAGEAVAIPVVATPSR